jgi:hypothetical protein
MRAMTRGHVHLLLILGGALLAAHVPSARAIPLDDRGEIGLGLRTYTDVRIGTEKKGGEDDPLSYPRSPTGHLRQHRYFLEVKLDHNLKRLAHEGWGVARLLGWLDPDQLKYTLHYRGEGEGIYDYGPSEWSNQRPGLQNLRIDAPNVPPLITPKVPKQLIDRRLARLRQIGWQRHRFFLGYVDLEKGPVFIRVGRQMLSWGETDVFRLLDNINPLDDSFGGFFIPLDERRMPLDMFRSSYQIGSVGPASDAFLEGFAAFGNRDAQLPGTPDGSPWRPGGLGFPRPQLVLTNVVPGQNDLRGGARLVFNLHDVTYSLAHYYTYLDIPGVRFRIPKPLNGVPAASFSNPILAEQHFPRVPISGGSMTTALPKIYSVLRSEVAYFQGEPTNRQGRGNSADSLAAPGTPGYRRLRQANNIEGGLDPFVYPGFFDFSRKGAVQGRVLRLDTFNWAIGLDTNQFVRWINRAQTLFISTQFFYKHVFNSPGDLILPVPFRNIPVSRDIPIIGTPGCGGGKRACQSRPRLLHLDDDRFLHTLLITTSYSSGRIIPSLGMFYDWQGAIVTQPGVTFIRDPFRFIFDYSRVDSAPTGQFGAVRDRDNVRFQAEFVF